MYESHMQPAPARARVIEVKISNVYGIQKIFPVNNDASIFAGMLKQTTLTRDNIESIKRLGYSVKVIQDVVSL